MQISKTKKKKLVQYDLHNNCIYSHVLHTARQFLERIADSRNLNTRSLNSRTLYQKGWLITMEQLWVLIW